MFLGGENRLRAVVNLPLHNGTYGDRLRRTETLAFNLSRINMVKPSHKCPFLCHQNLVNIITFNQFCYWFIFSLTMHLKTSIVIEEIDLLATWRQILLQQFSVIAQLKKYRDLIIINKRIYCIVLIFYYNVAGSHNNFSSSSLPQFG